MVERLNREIRRALAASGVKSRLEGLGNELRVSSPEEMRAHVAKEVARCSKVIRDAKISQL